MKLKVVRAHYEENTDIPDFSLPSNPDEQKQLKFKGCRHLEDDFILGNTDKLTFAMREF
jgi:hypothetical protein